MLLDDSTTTIKLLGRQTLPYEYMEKVTLVMLMVCSATEMADPWLEPAR